MAISTSIQNLASFQRAVAFRSDFPRHCSRLISAASGLKGLAIVCFNTARGKSMTRKRRLSRRMPLRLEHLARRNLPSATSSTALSQFPPAFANGRGLVGNQSRIADRLLELYND